MNFVGCVLLLSPSLDSKPMALIPGGRRIIAEDQILHHWYLHVSIDLSARQDYGVLSAEEGAALLGLTRVRGSNAWVRELINDPSL